MSQVRFQGHIYPSTFLVLDWQPVSSSSQIFVHFASEAGDASRTHQNLNSNKSLPWLHNSANRLAEETVWHQHHTGNCTLAYPQKVILSVGDITTLNHIFCHPRRMVPDVSPALRFETNLASSGGHLPQLFRGSCLDSLFFVYSSVAFRSNISVQSKRRPLHPSLILVNLMWRPGWNVLVFFPGLNPPKLSLVSAKKITGETLSICRNGSTIRTRRLGRLGCVFETGPFCLHHFEKWFNAWISLKTFLQTSSQNSTKLLEAIRRSSELSCQCCLSRFFCWCFSAMDPGLRCWRNSCFTMRCCFG